MAIKLSSVLLAVIMAARAQKDLVLSCSETVPLCNFLESNVIKA